MKTIAWILVAVVLALVLSAVIVLTIDHMLSGGVEGFPQISVF